MFTSKSAESLSLIEFKSICKLLTAGLFENWINFLKWSIFNRFFLAITLFQQGIKKIIKNVFLCPDAVLNYFI